MKIIKNLNPLIKLKIMKFNQLIIAGLMVSIAACTQTEKQPELSYPDTRVADHVDTYFDVDVPDPYRWLEDDLSEETGEWVKADIWLFGQHCLSG